MRLPGLERDMFGADPALACYSGRHVKNLRSFVAFVHSAIARGPRWLAISYISGLSAVSRVIDSPAISKRLQSSLCGPKWPPMDFAARKVTVGTHTSVLLHPHLGEFDELALFL